MAGANGQDGCCHPGCDQPGEYPAPRSRRNLRDYVWFCLEHVRDYNKSWDYYAGMDEAEIERRVRDDVTWQRPTWPLGTRSGVANGGHGPELRDDFGIFGDGAASTGTPHGANGRANGAAAPPDAERAALRVMNLLPPVTRDEVRSRYKDLVKQFHPDANGGDKQAEDRLKLIIQAYATLKNSPYLR